MVDSEYVVAALTCRACGHSMAVAVLDGELAVPCTRNPLQRG